MTIDYLIEQIRSNHKETPRAHAWLLTTLAIYGQNIDILIDLYRLFYEQKSYILLSFLIEYIIQYHQNEIENNIYLQEQFQLIFSKKFDNKQFSYSRIYSQLSLTTREIISTLLIRNSYLDLEENLRYINQSIEQLNQCREKALVCLTFSSSSIISILQLIINTELKIEKTSLNIFRCLFVQDLLPIVLKNEQKFDLQSHIYHKWLIYAMEFYFEYWLLTIKTSNKQIKLEGNNQQIFQCENPCEQIENLFQLTINMQQNFNWQQFIFQTGNSMISSNRRQKLLELQILIDRVSNSTIHCPLECFLFCSLFPIYIQSIVNLNKIFPKDSLFLYATKSLRKSFQQQNQFEYFDFIEDFSLFIQCLNSLQLSSMSSCIKIFQELIEKIHLNETIEIYSYLLRCFAFYFNIQKSKLLKDDKINQTIIIDDTPQSPTMQDESSIIPIKNPLICPDIEIFIQQLNDNSLESRLQLCSLNSLTQSKQSVVSYCIETLIYLHENHSSSSSLSSEILLPISSDYCFLSRSYSFLFNYILDLIIEQLPINIILFQIENEPLLTSIYPKDLLSTLNPLLLRYIYDQKLLKQLLKFIQLTTNNERRWILNSTNKRKLDKEENKINDEQFIEKIIQHVSNITQWSNEQKRQAIYSYIINEKQTLLQLLK